MSTSFLADGPRVAIRRICDQDYEETTALTRASAKLHYPWVPSRAGTREGFASYLARIEQPTHDGFVVCLRKTGEIVGGVNINNIVRGSLQSGTLGYVAYASTTGRGYMTEGLDLVIRFAFADLGLHRLEANIQSLSNDSSGETAGSEPAPSWVVRGAPRWRPWDVVGDPRPPDAEITAHGNQKVLARLSELEVRLRPCGDAGGRYAAGQPFDMPERVVQFDGGGIAVYIAEDPEGFC
ncbi:GNAT family N-acetyltransferase [Streptomyces sp. NPDC055239]